MARSNSGDSELEPNLHLSHEQIKIGPSSGPVEAKAGFASC
jgi:hypothetical protein